MIEHGASSHSILAKATNLCVYTKHGSGDYYWEIFRPMKDPLKLPYSAIEKPRGADHYEICYTLGCHYDLITDSDKVMDFDR